MPERLIPARPNLEQYKKQAKELRRDCRLGLPDALARLRRYHPDSRMAMHSQDERVALSDAQLVIAREHGFASWPKFAAFVEELTAPDSIVSAFEAAADAIVSGDLATLRSLIEQCPDLIRMRSTREHRAMLLHYVAANGVEDSRQKTPPNIVDVARLLLESGADVHAVCNAYGGSTVLELAGSSGHPEQAGVQRGLLEMLIESGGMVQRQGKNGKHLSAITACLANGRGSAAEYLADRSKQLILEDAAGTGRLEAVKSFFDASGTLLPSASREELQRGLLWASEYGHYEVVEFLLDRGANLSDQAGTKETCLHWAVIGAHVPTVEFLLKRGADLENRNGYGGTALGQALWCFVYGQSKTDYIPVIEMLISAGSKIDDTWNNWIASEKKLPDEARGRLSAMLHRAASE